MRQCVHPRSPGACLALVLTFVALAMGRAGWCEPTPTRRPNAATGKEKAEARVSPAAESVRVLLAAFSLVDYARRNRVPEALVVAAEMIESVGTSVLDAVPVNRSAGGRAKPSTGRSAGAPSRVCEPARLLLEAEEMSGGDPAVTEMARRKGHKMSVRRNAVGGPQYRIRSVDPGTTDVYTVWFRGRECSRVLIKGSGDGDLDLYVYDEDGNLVACDTGPTDVSFAEWVPERTGKFAIHVVNNGPAPNEYEIVTN